MTIARVTEIIASSPESFDDAIKRGVARSTKTLKNVKAAWVKDQSADIEDGKITSYKVILNVTFVLEE